MHQMMECQLTGTPCEPVVTPAVHTAGWNLLWRGDQILTLWCHSELSWLHSILKWSVSLWQSQRNKWLDWRCWSSEQLLGQSTQLATYHTLRLSEKVTIMWLQKQKKAKCCTNLRQQMPQLWFHSIDPSLETTDTDTFFLLKNTMINHLSIDHLFCCFHHNVTCVSDHVSFLKFQLSISYIIWQNWYGKGNFGLQYNCALTKATHSFTLTWTTQFQRKYSWSPSLHAKQYSQNAIQHFPLLHLKVFQKRQQSIQDYWYWMKTDYHILFVIYGKVLVKTPCNNQGYKIQLAKCPEISVIVTFS